jgi:polyphosphate glucokinase
MEILGIDVGGTGIKGAITDTSKGILLSERHRILTPLPATPDSIANVINQLVSHFNWTGTIGCGFPSVVRNNVVQTAVNIDKSWVNINLAELISERTRCNVKVLNDADAAGIAEMKFGAGKDNKGVVLIITVGTGIGTSLFTNGVLLPNSEFGQVIFKESIAENYISAKVKEEQDIKWKFWVLRFNEYLAYIEKLFYPDLIIIGGGICKKQEKFFDKIVSDAEIKIAEFKNEAGIIGAAIFAENNLNYIK